jgi:excisionase family DNA binding protein
MLRAAQLPADDVGDAVTVDQAARLLGCDPSTVRRLLKQGRLSGHRIGVGDRPNGVRVHVASIEAWRRRHAIGAAAAEPAPRPARRRAGAAHAEAIAQLRALGVAV